MIKTRTREANIVSGSIVNDAFTPWTSLRRYQARSVCGAAARLSTSAWLATNQHDKEYGKEKVVHSCSLCSVYGRRLKTEGVCAASEICHPDVNQYFVGFVRAPPNQPSVQPLLSVLSLPPSPSPGACSRLSIPFFLSFARAIVCARQPGQAEFAGPRVHPPSTYDRSTVQRTPSK